MKRIHTVCPAHELHCLHQVRVKGQAKRLWRTRGYRRPDTVLLSGADVEVLVRRKRYVEENCGFRMLFSFLQVGCVLPYLSLAVRYRQLCCCC